jgi:phosphate-selective porin OprO/OprP
VFGEYIRSSQRISGSVSAPLEVTNTGWEVTTSYVLTGEATSDRGVRPRAPFDPSAGAWGAVQLLARYASLDVDDEIFTARLAAPGSASRAQHVTIGLNWYPTYYIKYYTTFERTTFEEGSAPARADENVILFRIQLGF